MDTWFKEVLAHVNHMASDPSHEDTFVSSIEIVKQAWGELVNTRPSLFENDRSRGIPRVDAAFIYFCVVAVDHARVFSQLAFAQDLEMNDRFYDRVQGLVDFIIKNDWDAPDLGIISDIVDMALIDKGCREEYGENILSKSGLTKAVLFLLRFMQAQAIGAPSYQKAIENNMPRDLKRARRKIQSSPTTTRKRNMFLVHSIFWSKQTYGKVRYRLISELTATRTMKSVLNAEIDGDELKKFKKRVFGRDEEFTPMKWELKGGKLTFTSRSAPP